MLLTKRSSLLGLLFLSSFMGAMETDYDDWYVQKDDKNSQFEGSCEQSCLISACLLSSCIMNGSLYVRDYFPSIPEVGVNFSSIPTIVRLFPIDIAIMLTILSNRKLSCRDHSCICGKCKNAMNKMLGIPQRQKME